jgi:hypothetical protein
MNFTEIVILDYIDEWEQEAHVHVYTKDKRILAVHNIASNPTIDSNTVCIDFMQFGKRMTFAMPREDFSHIEYYYQDKPEPITKKDFDELYDYLEEDIDDFAEAYGVEPLREP